MLLGIAAGGEEKARGPTSGGAKRAGAVGGGPERVDQRGRAEAPGKLGGGWCASEAGVTAGASVGKQRA